MLCNEFCQFRKNHLVVNYLRRWIELTMLKCTLRPNHFECARARSHRKPYKMLQYWPALFYTIKYYIGFVFRSKENKISESSVIGISKAEQKWIAPLIGMRTVYERDEWNRRTAERERKKQIVFDICYMSPPKSSFISLLDGKKRQQQHNIDRTRG